MQLIQVDAKAGYLWFRQGIWVFRRNPLALIILFFAYIFSMMALSYIPVFSVFLRLVATPTVSVAFMIACRDTIAGKPVSPITLIAGLYVYGRTVAKQLLALGLIYVIAILITLALSTLFDGGLLFNLLVLGKTVSDAAIQNNNESLTLIVMAAAYVPISMLFWFAPVLTAWHGVPPHKALFFSFVACWRNRGAFTVYGLIWAALIFGASMLLITVRMSAMLAVIAPFCIVMTTILYCSFYATYRGCFKSPETKTPSPASDSITLN